MTRVAECGPARSARKAKGEGHLRRAEILEAAERIFVREGYAGATIRRIAEEVGVSSTAIYLHFRDKAEMLLEIGEGAFSELAQRNAAIRAEPMAPADRVRRMLEAYLDFALANPNAFRLALDSAAGEAASATPEAASELGHACYLEFEQAVAELADDGRLLAPPDVAAQALWAAVHGLASLLITKTGFPWADPRRVQRTLLDSLGRGLLR